MDDYILEIKDMKTDILKDIDFDLKAGEIHVLVGLGESGTRDFIRALAGIIDVSGEIFVKNKLSKFNLEVLRKDKIEFIFEKPTLFEDLTIEENISLNNFPSKKYLPLINWKGVKKNYEKVISMVNIDNIEQDTKVSQLSTEDKKKLAIAKSFLTDPEIIIMHEPTSDLAALSIQRLNNVMYNFKQRGGSVIYISKHWEEALKIADRISVLSYGEIIGTLDSKEANSNPRKLMNMIMGNEIKNEKKSEQEKENDDFLNFLNGVFKASELLTSEYELKDVLQLLAEYATNIMKADGCTINLIDKDTKTIIDTVNFTTNDKIEAKIKDSVIFEITEKDNIYYASDREKDFLYLFESLNNIKSIICLPVFVRSHVTGFIQMYYENVYIYSEKELLYLSTLGRQAAIAIEDTRLIGRSVLLQESHHRIKNNLQYIISLINLQKKFIEKDENNIEGILNNTIDRIKSIASVHDLLSKEKLGRSIINVKDIIKAIVKFLKNSKIDMILDLNDIFISYEKASAIALIINELVSNSLEHAFKDLDTGKIQIYCKRNEEKIDLIVKDNGIGFKEDFEISTLDSLGLSIVHSIVTKQFRGKIEIISSNGSEIHIEIPLSI
jgi:ribose transport system ATP-binding protein